MATVLPRVVPKTSRGDTPPLSGEAPPQQEHPFDGPYAIMKRFQAELSSLRVELQAEQRQRMADVSHLQREIVELREALAKERAERCTACEKVGAAQVTEAARSMKDVQELRAEAFAEIRKRTMARDFDLIKSQVSELIVHLDQEKGARIRGEQELGAKIKANEDGDNEFAQNVVRELDIQKQLLEQNTTNDKAFARNVMPRLLLAGQALLQSDGLVTSLTGNARPTTGGSAISNNTYPIKPTSSGSLIPVTEETDRIS